MTRPDLERLLQLATCLSSSEARLFCEVVAYAKELEAKLEEGERVVKLAAGAVDVMEGMAELVQQARGMREALEAVVADAERSFSVDVATMAKVYLALQRARV